MGCDEISPAGQNSAVQLARKHGEHNAKTDRHNTHCTFPYTYIHF